MLGMDMAAMMGGRDADEDEGGQEAPRRETKSDKIRKGLGRILGN
jgi:hypothetical protein